MLLCPIFHLSSTLGHCKGDCLKDGNNFYLCPKPWCWITFTDLGKQDWILALKHPEYYSIGKLSLQWVTSLILYTQQKYAGPIFETWQHKCCSLRGAQTAVFKQPCSAFGIVNFQKGSCGSVMGEVLMTLWYTGMSNWLTILVKHSRFQILPHICSVSSSIALKLATLWLVDFHIVWD